jgi:LPXTG-motif cell wall-anchored protein
MKNSRRSLIVSLIMVVVALVAMTHASYASFSLVTGNNAVGNQTLKGNNTTNVTNTAANNAKLNTPANNVTVVNNINENTTKDLPQTGETDTYVIAGIGIVAILIGTVAYIKSRRI